MNKKKHKASILIVEDEEVKRAVLEDELADEGYRADSAVSPLKAEPLLAQNSYDVVITDLRMPGQDGLSFLKELKQDNPDRAVIVITAYGTVDTAVAAMKLGAFDYIQKPFSTEQLLLKLNALFRYRRLTSENEAMKRRLQSEHEEVKIVGESPAMKKILSTANAVAANDASVLIKGETGVGKDIVARAIHESSYRADGPFIPVSCAALPGELIESELFGHEKGAFTGATDRRKGWIELAHGGTLFLDEVDDIPLSMQVKLLRVLQEHRITRVGGGKPINVNMRVIAATKADLQEKIRHGEFRDDLFYRLNVVPITIPPLRRRREDIPALTEHFLEKVGLKMNRERLSMSSGAVSRLQKHSWPGNVRELEHFIERIVALNPENELNVSDLPPLETGDISGDERMVSLSLDGQQQVNMPTLLSEVEKRLIAWAMERSGGNLSKSAKMLGVPRTTLQYKTEKSQG